MFKPILAHLPLLPQSIPEMAGFHASRTPSNCTGCPAGCPAGFHVRVFWKTKGIFKCAEKDKVFESARHSARRPPHCTRGIARHFPWCSPRRVAAADAMTTSHDAGGWWRPICLARFDTGRSVSCGEMSIIVSSGTRRSRSLSSSGWTSRTNGGRGSYGCTERICRSCARRSSSISGGSMVASSGAPAARSATSAPSECRRVPLLDTPPPPKNREELRAATATKMASPLNVGVYIHPSPSPPPSPSQPHHTQRPLLPATPRRATTHTLWSR